MMKPTSTAGRSEERSENPYKGIRKRKWGKWVSEIRLPNSRERIWLGSYDTPEKAARAFDAALFCLRGRNAQFNFPGNPPNIPGGRNLSPSEIQAVAAAYAKEEEVQPQRERCVPAEPNTDHTSPSSASDFSTPIDWSLFLNSDDSDSNFGHFSGMGNLDGKCLSPPPPPPSDFIDGDENGCEGYFQQSFLWNF